jgi:hypothetical protein
MEDLTHSLFFYAALAAIVLLAAVLWSLKRYGRVPLTQPSRRTKLLLIGGALLLWILLPILQVELLYR